MHQGFRLNFRQNWKIFESLLITFEVRGFLCQQENCFNLKTKVWSSVNFINILRAIFLYESALRSFLYLYFGAKILVQKARVKY